MTSTLHTLVRRPAVWLPAALLFISPAALAQLPGLISQPLANGGQSWSLPVQTLVLLTSLTFLPAMLLMMTSFTRIIIVLGLLRNALGTPSAPPNQVMLGLALFLTFFIMSPVFDKVYQDAYLPFSQDKIGLEVALDKGAQPLREFMLRQTRETDLALYARLANQPPLAGPEAVPMRILLPAYVTSELKNRLPDRFYGVHSVPDYRPGGRQRADGAGDDDGATGHHLATVQADVVRAGRWLAAAARLAGAELLFITRPENAR
jgi:Flagellar biosynthesis pathway, component FliP